MGNLHCHHVPVELWCHFQPLLSPYCKIHAVISDGAHDTEWSISKGYMH
jgi:hypothetical protein